jgi:DNA-binding XRE family transcriptional regulator
MPRRSRHSGALRFLHDRYFSDKPPRLASLENERLSARVARQIYDLRTAANLTQRQLASLVGTTASVICQLEDSDYSGHSLSMLQRIAAALSSRIEFRFVPARKAPLSRTKGKKRKTA